MNEYIDHFFGLVSSSFEFTFVIYKEYYYNEYKMFLLKHFARMS